MVRVWGPGRCSFWSWLQRPASIRKAAAQLGMSYRKAWLLLQALKETFGTPLVETASGGKSGAGRALPPQAGRFMVRYRKLELAAGKAAAADLKALTRKMAANKLKH